MRVSIKHAGKTHELELNLDQPPSAFKDAVHALTGVPPDRMKVMIKGGVLKDDMNWKKISPKEGQTFMVIGAAGELPKPPAKPTVFLEDMDDSELAEALAKPVGLRNLGNTCYMNASLQALRAIPELQIALNVPALTGTITQPLPRALRDLYSSMGRTTAEVTPVSFLQVLRQFNPQFAEIDRRGGRATGMGMLGGYAQQDAEECYAALVNSLRELPGLEIGRSPPSEPSPPPLTPSTPTSAPAPPSLSTSTSTTNSSQAAPRIPGSFVPGDIAGKKFVDQFLMGEMRRELRCDEAPDEPPTVSMENVLKIECNISVTTNYMLTGIMNSLDQKVEKNSPSLGRQAIYSQRSRLTRLPTYLTVHMVRFAWRNDIGKKAKIMRKVKFPLEFDALDLATDDLKAKMMPVSRRLKEMEKERMERRKVRQRTKASGSAPPAGTDSKVAGGDVEMADASAGAASGSSGTSASAVAVSSGTGGEDDGKEKEKEKEKEKVLADGELEDESVYLAKEIEQLEALVDPTVKADIGCSVSGLYDLVAIVTHKGAAADAGHYMGFVKKSMFHGTAAAAGGDVDEDWYKFDDERVSVFPKEKLNTLDGGGEDSSAYVLLYRSKILY